MNQNQCTRYVIYKPKTNEIDYQPSLNPKVAFLFPILGLSPTTKVLATTNRWPTTPFNPADTIWHHEAKYLVCLPVPTSQTNGVTGAELHAAVAAYVETSH
jgi:hypothetical protein